MKNVNASIEELVKAKKFNPSFDEQFIIFRYLKMSEDMGYTISAEGQQDHNSHHYDQIFKLC